MPEAVVGPPTEVIDKMGDKVAARQVAKNINIPTIPGTDGPLRSVWEAQEFVQQYVPVPFVPF